MCGWMESILGSFENYIGSMVCVKAAITASFTQYYTGPFVRINPEEVHCNDPAFFDALYVSSAKRRTDKSMWLVRQSYAHC